MPNVRPTEIKVIMRIDYSIEALTIAVAWRDGTSPIRSGRKSTIPLENFERIGPGHKADAFLLHAMISADVPTDVCDHVMARWRTEFDWVEETSLVDPRPTYSLVHRGPGPRGHESFSTPSVRYTPYASNTNTIHIEEAPPEHRFPETAAPVLARLEAEVEMCEDSLQQSRLRAILDHLRRLAPPEDDLDDPTDRDSEV